VPGHDGVWGRDKISRILPFEVVPGAAPMSLLKVGKPLPYRLEGSDGLTTFMEPTMGDEGIESMFVASLANIDPREFDALIQEPIRFGILVYEPLVFVVLDASGIILLDSPFGIGLYPPELVAALRTSARCAHGWPPNVRRSTILVIVDPVTMIIQRIRKTTLTRNWWVVLSDALECCPSTLSTADYRAATQRAYSRWSSPLEMLPHCAIIEENGS
jgi:hypothetical protein